MMSAHKPKRNRQKPRDPCRPSYASKKTNCNQINPIAFVASFDEGNDSGRVHVLRKRLVIFGTDQLPSILHVNVASALDLFANPCVKIDGQDYIFDPTEHIQMCTMGEKAYELWCLDKNYAAGTITSCLEPATMEALSLVALYKINDSGHANGNCVGKVKLGDTQFTHEQEGIQSIHCTIIFTHIPRASPEIPNTATSSSKRIKQSCQFPDSSSDEADFPLDSHIFVASFENDAEDGMIHEIVLDIIKPPNMTLPSSLNVNLTEGSLLYNTPSNLRESNSNHCVIFKFDPMEHVVRSYCSPSDYNLWCVQNQIIAGTIDRVFSFANLRCLSLTLLYKIIDDADYKGMFLGTIKKGQKTFQHPNKGLQSISTTLTFSGFLQGRFVPENITFNDPTSIVQNSINQTTERPVTQPIDPIFEPVTTPVKGATLENIRLPSAIGRANSTRPLSVIVFENGIYMDKLACSPPMSRPLSESIICLSLLDKRIITFMDPSYIYIHKGKSVVLPI